MVSRDGKYARCLSLIGISLEQLSLSTPLHEGSFGQLFHRCWIVWAPLTAGDKIHVARTALSADVFEHKFWEGSSLRHSYFVEALSFWNHLRLIKVLLLWTQRTNLVPWWEQNLVLKVHSLGLSEFINQLPARFSFDNGRYVLLGTCNLHFRWLGNLDFDLFPLYRHVC
jgi:hypothetical protein